MQFDDATADELPLVFDSWSRSFKKSPWAGCVLNKDWDQVSRNAAAEIIARPTSRVIVAYIDLPDGNRRVMGYSVSEPSKKILHWMFVKRDYRVPGLQIGTHLLKHTMRFGDAEGRWLYTYRTHASKRFLGPQFTWDTTAARVKSYE